MDPLSFRLTWAPRVSTSIGAGRLVLVNLVAPKPPVAPVRTNSVGELISRVIVPTLNILPFGTSAQLPLMEVADTVPVKTLEKVSPR
jgi:hypothetical protein